MYSPVETDFLFLVFEITPMIATITNKPPTTAATIIMTFWLPPESGFAERKALRVNAYAIYSIICNIYRLLNVYRKIFGTSSYGEDARACECISAI